MTRLKKYQKERPKVYRFTPALGMPVLLERPDPRVGTIYYCRDKTKVDRFYEGTDRA